MKKLILICGLLTSGFSFGADWVYVGSSKSGDKFYIDFDYYDYNKRTNTTRLWYKIEENNNGVYYTQDKTFAEYYCGGVGRFKVLSALYYYPNGDIRKSFEANYHTQSEVIFPDTTGEFLYKVACDTPGKGLDFKDKSIDEMDNFYEYERARFAYMREKMPNSIPRNLVPNLNITDYDSYSDFIRDEKKEMDKIRIKNIQKFK